MFKIIIHVFQIENICINEIILMFKIIIHAFQMDINCILMKLFFMFKIIIMYFKRIVFAF